MIFVQGTQSPPAPQFRSINSLSLSFLYGPTLPSLLFSATFYYFNILFYIFVFNFLLLITILITFSPGSLDSSWCFIQPGISYDVLCTEVKQAGQQYTALMYSFCIFCHHFCMKWSLGISNFPKEISSLSHSVIFLYFFAMITEEGFLISPCYSLELCLLVGISFLFSFAFSFYSFLSYL